MPGEVGGVEGMRVTRQGVVVPGRDEQGPRVRPAVGHAGPVAGVDHVHPDQRAGSLRPEPVAQACDLLGSHELHGGPPDVDAGPACQPTGTPRSTSAWTRPCTGGIGRDAVGYRPVGVLRRYERDVDGTGWHDGLLMDLLVEELAQPR